VALRMSALGQKRTFRGAIAVSALPPKADIRRKCLAPPGTTQYDLGELPPVFQCRSCRSPPLTEGPPPAPAKRLAKEARGLSASVLSSGTDLTETAFGPLIASR